MGQRFLFSICEVRKFILLSEFSFTNIHDSHDSKGREKLFFNSSVPPSQPSQALIHQPDDYFRESSRLHISQQPESNWEPLVSDRKSLTTKLFPNSYVNENTFFLNTLDCCFIQACLYSLVYCITVYFTSGAPVPK